MAGPCGEKQGGPDLQSRNGLAMVWFEWSEPRCVGRVRRVELYDCSVRLLNRRGTRRAAREALCAFPRLYQSPVNPEAWVISLLLLRPLRPMSLLLHLERP